MATVRLHAGTVADIGTTFGTGGGLTGSGAVWDDASDSTYLESKTPGVTQQAQAQAPLDTLTLPAGATVTNIRVNMRAQMLATSASPAHVGIIIWPASHLSPQVGLCVPSSDLTGWLLDPASKGTIVDLTDDIDATQYSNSFTSLAAIVTLLQSGTAYITALARPITFPTRNNIQVRVYELSVDVTYDAPVDTPCDTWVDLDLSTATFANPSGAQFGQYVDGVITGLDGNYPQFWFDFELDPVKRYRTEVTFDPGSAWDGDGNPLTSDRFVTLRDASPGYEDTDSPAQIGDGASNTADVCPLTIGPGIGNWDDPDFGVAQGYYRLLFQTSGSGAVSAIRVRKLCTTAIPPLQLVNRRDAFSSAPSLVNAGFHRQGGNRLTGPI